MADSERYERTDVLIIDETGTQPTVPGSFRYVGGSLKAVDAAGTFDLRTGGTGLTEAQHKILRQLIHFISEGPAEGFASGAYKEVSPAADPFPTSIIWYTSAAKTNKIVEKTITYNANKTPSTIVWKVYDTSNILLATVTDTITYSGIFETSRTRAIA